MELLALLEMMRSDYLLEYTSAYHDQLLINEEVFPEIALELSGTVYKKLFVIDLLGKNGDANTAIEVGTSDNVYSGAVSLSYKGLSASFDHVSWDSMRFQVFPEPNSLEGFEGWFDKWMDIDATRHKDGEIYGQTIHSSTLDARGVEVDFGSATTEAVIELFELFIANGVESVNVTSGKIGGVET
jgi:hypothetical protein